MPTHRLGSDPRTGLGDADRVHEERGAAAPRARGRGVDARSYARQFGEDEELWRVTALLHDFDYEIHPTLDKHPQDGAPILREVGYPEEVDRGGALARRAPRRCRATRRSRRRSSPATSSPGFVHACGLVRPDRARRARAEVGEEEAEAAVVRGRRPPRRGLRGRRAARRSSSTSTSRTSSRRCSRSRRELGPAHRRTADAS